MLSPLDSQPLNLVMEMLENIAKRHNIPFNISLINFADDIYKIAYERGMEDANRHTFVYDPERDGPAEFVPPRSLHIAGEAKLEANTSNEPTNNPTHEAVQSYWGERCAEHEDGCPTCVAWEHYDGQRIIVCVQPQCTNYAGKTRTRT